MEQNSLAKTSTALTCAQPATPSTEAIREFLVEAGTNYGKQISPALIGIWQRELGRFPEETLRKAMQKTFRECKFFPNVADFYENIDLIQRVRFSEFDFSESPELPAPKPLPDYSVCREHGEAYRATIKNRMAEPLPAPVVEPEPYTVFANPKRVEFLQKQAVEIKAKYP